MVVAVVVVILFLVLVIVLVAVVCFQVAKYRARRRCEFIILVRCSRGDTCGK